MDNEIFFQSVKKSQSTLHFKYLHLLLTFFSATWLISCITAVKLITIFGITLTGGFFIFPFTSSVSLIIEEIYGYKNARQALWCGLLLNVLFISFVSIVYIIPASPSWSHNVAYHDILIQSLRITTASLMSFIISFFSGAYIMARMKIVDRGKSLSKRILLSRLLTITIDLSFFIPLAFAGKLPSSLFIKLFIAAYVKRIICELVFMPLIWYFIDKIKVKEGVEIYDLNTKFTPFSMDNIYEISAYKKVTLKENNSIIKIPNK